MNFKVYYSGKCLNFFICFVLLSKITFMNLGFLLLFSHLSCVWLFVTSWKAAHQASLSFISPRACSNSWLLSRWCHPNTSPSVTPLFLLSSIFPNIKIFSNESALHIRWPKHWSFGFSISPSNQFSELISFRDGLVGSPCSPRASQEISQRKINTGWHHWMKWCHLKPHGWAWRWSQ